MAIILGCYGRIGNINENRVSWLLLRAVEEVPGEKREIENQDPPIYKQVENQSLDSSLERTPHLL